MGRCFSIDCDEELLAPAQVAAEVLEARERPEPQLLHPFIVRLHLAINEKPSRSITG